MSRSFMLAHVVVLVAALAIIGYNLTHADRSHPPLACAAFPVCIYVN